MAALVAAGAVSAAPLAAASPAEDRYERAPLRAAGPGLLEEDFSTGAEMEVLALDEGLVPALLATANDETVRVEDWPVAPDRREPVVLTRREVYAPGARILRVGGGRRVELPRSRLVFFLGESELDAETRLAVSVHPETRALEGVIEARLGRHELRPEPARDGGRVYRLAKPEVFRPAEESAAAAEWTCGSRDAPQAMPLVFEGAASKALFEPAISTLHTATVAIDTDYELVANKFGGNTTALTDWIASLFAQMSAMYERDLRVRLLQGTTFLRTTPSDPWSGGSGAADVTKLDQFRLFWIANYGGVGRAVAALLSGKSTSGASGIAYVNALCNTTYGYSFTQVFGFAGALGQDARIVGHEIGHNFGSRHTHCYLTPTPIDTCYNGEAGNGCYGGSVACPAPTTMSGVPNVRGTVMSYCHQLGGCSTTTVFHPRTIQLLDPIIEGKTTGAGACIFPAVSGPTITAVAPQSGSTAGGTPITLLGTGFAAGATVTVGGVAAASVTVLGPTTITAVTGPHTTGAVSVVVTNPDGAGATLANSFFYTPPPPALGFFTLPPCRVIDTRGANGALGGPALAAGGVRVFDLTGTCGIPNGAQALSVNVTVVTPGATGHLSIYPGNAFPFNASAINFRAGATRANNGQIGLATNGAGTVGVQNVSAAATHFILDVNGYYE
ncbi:MAG TPA: M12 family metallo-peptidase [Thermoanaerobaculia bacterium]|nr:M12 family metallo-peptidase [Thermoanaerobaculia bacterium]